VDLANPPGSKLKGRWLAETATKGSVAVIVVNETTVTRYFKGQDPIASHATTRPSASIFRHESRRRFSRRRNLWRAYLHQVHQMVLPCRPRSRVTVTIRGDSAKAMDRYVKTQEARNSAGRRGLKRLYSTAWATGPI